jgi:two-component system, OmpR family, response regulator ResD
VLNGAEKRVPLLTNSAARFIMRTLVLEDVQETRDAIKSLLERDEYLVDGASDEDDAVPRSLANRPDLILISLSGTSDEVLGVARRVREKSGLTKNTPVVIFSITTIPAGAEQEITGNTYITAPHDFNQLRKLIASVLSRKSRTQ